MAKILVVGGAGYVGSSTCAWLKDRGHEIWILDDLTTGHRELALALIPAKRLIQGKAGDRALLEPLLTQQRFDCVMHFAARSLVGESVQKPLEYHENNVVQTRNLLEAMAATQTRRFIFSSSCAIFGDPGTRKISETLDKRPLSPYGQTKLDVEQMLETLSLSQGLQSVALRYFNAAGAEGRTRVGEWHEPETHLLPNILRAALNNSEFLLFGTDYPTPDGTCIRDYIHVTDLAAAHGAAMERLLQAPPGGLFEAFNLGSENGFSVREILRACEKVSGVTIRVNEQPRRPGDPPRLVADASLAKSSLGFKTTHSIEQIVTSAWHWEGKRRLLLSKPKEKAVFLDRDGTLNEDPGYIADPSLLRLLPGVPEALLKLKKAGYKLIVASNQSGVARGLIPPGALQKVHARLDELLAVHGVTLDHYELCLHHPDDNCACRKPKPTLLFAAAHKLGINLSRSFMIGDKQSDLETGHNAGCRASILVRTGHGKETENSVSSTEADFSADSLIEAADWISIQEA